VNGESTYLGFDFGRRRIGVAAGQRLTASAMPLATVANHAGEPDWRQLDRLVAEWQPGGLVVGVPLHLDGAEQAETRAARAFRRQLAARYNLPTYAAEERLTTRAASAQIAHARAAGHGRRSRKGDVDRVAARLILEEWLANPTDDDDRYDDD